MQTIRPGAAPLSLHARRYAVISAAFLTCYAIVDFVFPALSTAAGPESISAASLLFLPHGVRVIAAWLYGWKAVLYLAPAAYLTHALRFDFQFADLGHALMPLFGVICASFVFDVTARAGLDLRLRPGYVARWHLVLLVGALASVINAVGTNLIAGNPPETMLFFLVGDILGMIALFIVLMLVFRVLRRRGW